MTRALGEGSLENGLDLRTLSVIREHVDGMNKIREGSTVESGAAQIGSLVAGLDAQFELSELLRSLDATLGLRDLFAATDDCLGISAAADLLGSRDAINVLVASYEERKALDDEVAAAVFPPKTDG